MEIREIPARFSCPACNKSFGTKAAAEHCLRQHTEAFKNACPPYEVGARVVTHRYNDTSFGAEITTIVRAKGELWQMELLVESKDGERYWIKAATYSTDDLTRDPARFDFAKLA